MARRNPTEGRAALLNLSASAKAEKRKVRVFPMGAKSTSIHSDIHPYAGTSTAKPKVNGSVKR
jgi:hypothetical protein